MKLMCSINQDSRDTKYFYMKLLTKDFEKNVAFTKIFEIIRI